MPFNDSGSRGPAAAEHGNRFAPALSEPFLADLAPAPLANWRQKRSRGDERTIGLTQLGANVSETVRQLYETLGGLEASPTNDSARPPPRPAPAASRATGADLIALARRLGREESPVQEVNKVLHDVRSGALTALVAALDRAAEMAVPGGVSRYVALLARDQRKLMRATIADLDPERRQRDLELRLHSVARLLDPVRALGSSEEGSVAVSLDCRFEGALTTCCAELGTLERVFYNLLNNATRHGSGGAIGLWLLPEPAVDPHDLRVVIANAIVDDRRDVLVTRFGGPWLPAERESSASGAGLGLRICAELVADAYGLFSTADCVRGGYVGARPSDDIFVAWFHWPVVRHEG